MVIESNLTQEIKDRLQSVQKNYVLTKEQTDNLPGYDQFILGSKLGFRPGQGLKDLTTYVMFYRSHMKA